MKMRPLGSAMPATPCPLKKPESCCKIDDQGMARKRWQGKVIERMDDLRHIQPLPALAAARLHDVLGRDIECGVVSAVLDRSLLHSLSPFLLTGSCS